MQDPTPTISARQPTRLSATLRSLLPVIVRAALLLFVISVVVFGLTLLLPGDPAIALAGDSATAEVLAGIRAELGLDQSIVMRYFSWIGAVLQGDFGNSFQHRAPVAGLIWARLPMTASLTLVAIFVAVTFGLVAGVLAATHRGSWVDRITTAISTFGIATPNFWIGLILIIIVSLKLRWLPATGYAPLSEGLFKWFSHLILPGAALGLALGAELQRQTRSAVIEVLQQDYIRTARAQGLSRAYILWTRALRNASGTVLTVIGFQIAILMGGSIVVEKIFGISGLGTLMLEAVFNNDMPLIQGVVLVNALIVVAINLLTDFSYRALNPKVRLS